MIEESKSESDLAKVSKSAASTDNRANKRMYLNEENDFHKRA